MVNKDPGPEGLENPAVVAAIVVTSVVVCCCISIGILTIPHKTKIMFGKRRTTLAKARASLDVARVMKSERPGMATLAQRETLAAKMEGSQWWYIDLEGEEHGPYSSQDMIAWAEWDYLNVDMWTFELPKKVSWRQRKRIQYVSLNDSRLSPFLGASVPETTTTTSSSLPSSSNGGIQMVGNPMAQKRHTSMKPISKPRGTLTNKKSSR